MVGVRRVKLRTGGSGPAMLSLHYTPMAARVGDDPTTFALTARCSDQFELPSKKFCCAGTAIYSGDWGGSAIRPSVSATTPLQSREKVVPSRCPPLRSFADQRVSKSGAHRRNRTRIFSRCKRDAMTVRRGEQNGGATGGRTRVFPVTGECSPN